jgi:hypothetical protein
MLQSHPQALSKTVIIVVMSECIWYRNDTNKTRGIMKETYYILLT